MDTGNPFFTRFIYALLVIVNLMIGALLLEIGKGTVPWPENLEWMVPMIVAGLTGATMFLPRIGSEPLAGRVNNLKRQGVPRSRMRVMDIDNPRVIA